MKVLTKLILFLFSISTNAYWLLTELSPQSAFFHPTTCTVVPGLTPRQRELCARNPDSMHGVVQGLRMALDECHRSFKNQLWNCSVSGSERNSLKLASKESAFVYAISAAGVSHALARSCAKGEIEDCGCGPTPSAHSKKFVWAGCSDNVRYGNNFGRRFIDQIEKSQSDTRSMVNLHNNRVGRRLLAANMKRECKCHGVSGSCVTKTCWKIVPRFDEFTLKLKEKYNLAQQVSVSPNGNQLMMTDDGMHLSSENGRVGRYLKEVDRTKIAKNELVYLDSSPDYCAQSTRGRECSDNCKSVCCGRGWDTVRELAEEPCHCKFIWCCEVKCKTCTKIVDRNYCR